MRLATSLTLGALVIGLSVTGVAQLASAASIGTGAVSIKGPGSELVPGVTVEIRENDCNGQPVWLTTTTTRPDAYGAFGIGLAPGQYCIVTLSVPSPYSVPSTVIFTMEARPANWVTVWLPGPPPIVTGALVVKDAFGAGVNGVTAFISEGVCGSGGQGVWRNTTATSRWSTGGFGIGLSAGTYCATAEYVPPGYQVPEPVTFAASSPGPVWVTLWTTEIPISGTGDGVVNVAIESATRILEFSCPACTGNTSVWAGTAEDPKLDLLVNTIGAYSGRQIIGFADFDSILYTTLTITANSPWTLRTYDISEARQVGSSATGSGDDVIMFNSAGAFATMSHHGEGYFGIWALSYTGDFDLLANTIGDYWGTRPLVSPALLQITSEGSWQIDLH